MCGGVCHTTQNLCSLAFSSNHLNHMATKKDYPTSAEEYELLELIGAGSGDKTKVYRAKIKKTGEEVAIKMIDLENYGVHQFETIRVSNKKKVSNLIFHFEPKIIIFSFI